MKEFVFNERGNCQNTNVWEISGKGIDSADINTFQEPTGTWVFSLFFWCQYGGRSLSGKGYNSEVIALSEALVKLAEELRTYPQDHAAELIKAFHKLIGNQTQLTLF
ncbi:hypothetical protein ACS5NO_32040 [Larkinella sp. GY13]|uniref:hypothetical protein n=1 Tax=Larkinella sp. GY13 TaxID=3453720 RepID=UPI003EEF7B60